MIGSWSQVQYIEHIQLLVDGASKASRIYGNLRNCATVEVQFQAYTSHNVQHKLYSCSPGPGFQVQLVDYDSGEPLPWEMFPLDWNRGQGVFYSTCCGKFENCGITNQNSQQYKERILHQFSSVKFHVYGLAEEEFKKSIGVIFRLTNGKISGASQILNSHDEYVNKERIDIQVLPPIVYTMKHLKPLKWRQVKLDTRDSTGFKQWNAFLQLDNDKFFWTHCDFNNYPGPCRTDSGQLYRINQSSNFKCPSYTYFLCPLGHKATYILRKLGPTEPNLKLVYNQEPGSLCLIRLKNLINQTPSNQEKKEKQLLHQTSVTISLYDLYGNQGSFRISLNDSYL